MDSSTETGPKDILLHIFSVVSLYISVVALGALLFQYINMAFPDLLSFEPPRSARGAIRWPLAVLVVVFPLYLWASVFLQRDVINNPEKRELKTRKWLLYITLLLASAVIAGDLIALIYQFLNGELSARFALKVLAVFLIAGTVFTYYGWNLKKDLPPSKDSGMKFFVYGAVGLTFAAILAGFFLAGSPQQERLRRFDDRRVGDLQNIQWQIVQFWQGKERLPNSLEELRDDISGFLTPLDPETGETYGYRKTGELSFELCAVFKTSGLENALSITKPVALEPFTGQENWNHGTGRVCFDRTIDPDLYPPRPQK